MVTVTLLHLSSTDVISRRLMTFVPPDNGYDIDVVVRDMHFAVSGVEEAFTPTRMPSGHR